MANAAKRAVAVIDTLREILDGVSETETEALIGELLRVWRENKKVYIIGAGRANLIMRTFAMRLMQIGFRSCVVFDTSTPAMEAGDLLIAGTGSGTTETVVVIARQARALGARLALFSKSADSALAQEADAVVQIPTGRCTQKLQSKGSEFEQSLFILCDSIGVELMERLGCINDVSEIDRFIKILHANLQ
jgi:6-phospho-3-hexuloisomerase